MDDTNHQLPKRRNPSFRPRRSQKAEDPFSKIHPDTRDIIQKGFLAPIFTLPGQNGGRLRDEEVHEGICGNHSGARSLVHKLVRAGYYWSTMQKDAISYTRACDKCQRFGNLIHSPPKTLTPMMAPWLFAQWGLDIMGPLLVGRRQMKFLVVGINYFTKWVEAEPLATITEKNIKGFV